jgi:hypothetical protein
MSGLPSASRGMALLCPGTGIDHSRSNDTAASVDHDLFIGALLDAIV